MKRILNLLTAVVVICLLLPGCSWMSKSGRQQMAYRNYVRKQIHGRQRQIARSQKAALRNAKYITPSEPKVSMNAQPLAQPVRESESVSEPVAEPVTVSASTATEKDNAQGEP